MRRHASWIAFLLLVPVTYFLLALLTSSFSTWARTEQPVNAGLLTLLVLVSGAAAFIVPAIFLVLAIVRMRRTYRRAQRRRGRLTAGEREYLAHQQRVAGIWEHARTLRGSLLARHVPAALSQWDVVPRAGEIFFARMNLGYARYYGKDVSYSTGGGFYFGRPAFVIGAFAVSAVFNSVAKSNAQAQAAPQWREQQMSHVLVSNQRLIVHANGEWLSFDYGAMAAVYPEVGNFTLVCQFHSAEPMVLSGPEVPIAAIYTVLQTYGPDALAAHPSLQPLNVGAPPSTLKPIGKEKAPPR